MSASEFCAIAASLMRHPAVAYHEHAVREEVERFLAIHGFEFSKDAFGNLIIHWQTDRALRPLVLAAHLDHPGFEITSPISNKKWIARFRGGVPPDYFKKGTRLRLMPGSIPGLLG